MINRSKSLKPTKIVVVGPGTFGKPLPEFHPKPSSDEFYVASWGALWGRRLKERYPDLDIEVWRAEPMFNNISNRIAFGIPCSIYPYTSPLISKTITFQMLKKLHEYSKQFQLVIHLNTIFDWQFNMVMTFLIPKAKFILSHHGGTFNNSHSLKNTLKKNLILFSYRNIYAITYLRKNIHNIIYSYNQKVILQFLPVGADFDKFTPLDKTHCRKILGLEPDKIYGVYVGKFYRLKGVDLILNTYNTFNKDNFEVLFIGGNKDDELFNEVAASGCHYWEYINHDKLQIILSAADLYIHPAFSPDFGGFDVSLIEALACNIPVLSPQLNELDFEHSELGIALSHKDDLTPKLQELISNLPQLRSCREIAIKYLDGKTAIIDKLYELMIAKR